MRPAGKAERTRTSDVYPEYKLLALRRRDGYRTDLQCQSFIKHNVRHRAMLRSRKTTMKMEDPQHVHSVRLRMRAQQTVREAWLMPWLDAGSCSVAPQLLAALSSSSKYHCSARISNHQKLRLSPWALLNLLYLWQLYLLLLASSLLLFISLFLFTQSYRVG